MRHLIHAVALSLFAVSAIGQVAYDAYSASHTQPNVSTNESSFQWSHTPSGTPAGVAVLVWGFGGVGSFGPTETAVDYGSLSLSYVTQSFAEDTAGEEAYVDIWFGGSSVPTGQQTVTVTRANSGIEMVAVAVTFTAGGDTAVYTSGIALLEEDQEWAEQSVNDGSPGTNSTRIAWGYTGNLNPIGVGSNTTSVWTWDNNSWCLMVGRETTPGQGSRSVGFSSATVDDVAATHFAVYESGEGGSTARCSAKLLLWRLGCR